MNWKQSLDRYLTTAPESEFDNYCENVVNNMSDDFYECNEKWIGDLDGACANWLNKLSHKENDCIKSAAIIERAFKLYKL